VDEFMLWDVSKVSEVIANTDEYKPNCALVIMDFLIRHGFVAPDQPKYVELVQKLRQGQPQ
jgi:hypothetical protein